MEMDEVNWCKRKAMVIDRYNMPSQLATMIMLQYIPVAMHL